MGVGGGEKSGEGAVSVKDEPKQPTLHSHLSRALSGQGFGDGGHACWRQGKGLLPPPPSTLLLLLLQLLFELTVLLLENLCLNGEVAHLLGQDLVSLLHLCHPRLPKGVGWGGVGVGHNNTTYNWMDHLLQQHGLHLLVYANLCLPQLLCQF